MLKAILSHYPWQVNSVQQVQKGVYQIKTDAGCFGLKQISKPLAKMKFVWGAMEYLPEHGFNKLPKLVTTNEADIPLAFQGDIYFAYQWVAGRRADFACVNDLVAVASTLAGFHKAACGLELAGARRSYFRKTGILKCMLKDLEHWGLEAELENSEFARLYLELLPYYLTRTKRALQLLKRANYGKTAKTAALNKTFIHGDVAARNFVIDQGTAYLIDFDYCRYDLQVMDLTRLCQRSLRLWAYDKEVLAAILEAYSQNRQLTGADIMLFSAFFCFPQKYWRLGKRHFEDKETVKSLSKLKILKQRLPDEDKLLRFLWQNKLKGVDYDQ